MHTRFNSKFDSPSKLNLASKNQVMAEFKQAQSIQHDTSITHLGSDPTQRDSMSHLANSQANSTRKHTELELLLYPHLMPRNSNNKKMQS